MEVFQRSRNLGGVKTGVVFRNTLARAGLKRSEEFSTAAIFHAKIKMVFRLERVVKSNNEGMVARCENFLFGKGALDLVSLDHLSLAQD